MPAPTNDSAAVQVRDYIPNLYVDLRYATTDNFTGQVIYDFTEPLLRYGTVKKLMAVQEELNELGYSLLIWDGYRPPAAQFKLWEIVPDGNYVANPYNGYSSHSRGNTVDVTLVTLSGEAVEMPSDFDEFAAIADRDYSDVSETAKTNALLLEQLMQKHGFNGYWNEWWHYSDTVSYEAEELKIGETQSEDSADWFAFIGRDLNAVIDAFGSGYEEMYDAGGRCVYYSDLAAQFFYNESDRVVYCVVTGGEREIGKGLNGRMTYPEIVNAADGMSLPEPEGFYNELTCAYEYMLQFDLDGIHIAFSWSEDPDTAQSSYVMFSDMSLLQ